MNEYCFELAGSLKVANTLGEGIIWNKADGAVGWADIQQSRTAA